MPQFTVYELRSEVIIFNFVQGDSSHEIIFVFQGSNPFSSGWNSAGAGAGASRRRTPTPPRGHRRRSSGAAPAAGAKMSLCDAREYLGFGRFEEPSEELVKGQYRKLAMQFHPDRRQNHNKKEEATEKFQRLQEAFNLLSGK